MKGKLKFHVALVLAFVFAFVGILTLTVNNVSVVSAEEAKHIDFTPVANYTKNYDENNDGVNDALLIDTNNYSTPTSFTVSYNVTYNDGINSILLLPQFNSEVFSISAIDVKETVLGSATITNEGFDKILLESENFYNAVSTENATEALITITFNIDNPVNGDYKFGLKLEPFVHNEVSEAYYWLDGTKLGEQEQVEIRVIETEDELNTVKIRTLLDAEIEIGHNSPEEAELEYAFVYAKQPVAVQKVAEFSEESTNLEVEYTYNGTATPVIKWYTITDYNGNEPVYTEYSQQYNLNTLTVPQTVGTYYVGISAPAHGVYRAVAEEIRRVIITPASITITIGNETSAYGDPIVSPLTAYTVTGGTVYTGDDLLLSQFNTEATSTSPVGNYAITCSTMNTNPNYSINIVNGTYSITAKAITITAKDQTAEYTGSEPTVDQSAYTVTGATITEGVVITKATGANVGSYTLTPSYNNNNYNITFVTGTFTITSVGLGADYVKTFFSGDEVTYDATSHNLLIVAENKPNWIGYNAENNIQTNANTYQITVNILVSAQDAKNYIDANLDGDQEYVAVVTGIINPYAITVTADNKGHVYGNNPETLTPATVGFNDEVNVTFTVKNGDEVITLSKTTPVEQYTIVPSATNTNYTFTFNNGTYTVTKATASIVVNAEDVFYNRDYIYSATAKVNNINLEQPTIVVKDANGNPVDTNTVLDAGTYTVEVTVAGNANYNGATETKTFEVKKIALETPTLTYDATTATWTAVTKDAQGKDLYNSTITYKVNETVVDGLSYKVNSKDELTLHVTSSNPNYNGVDVALEITVYAVTFEDGAHPANQGEPENMPAAQYIISGGLATQPSNPTIYGYTFQYWNDGNMSNNQFDFTTPITADKTLKAVWSANYYKVRFKISDDDAEPVEQDVVYNGKISSVPADPEKVSDNAGITYTFSGWYAEDVAYRKGNLYLANVETGEDYTVTKEVTFVAHYTENYLSFKVSYKVSTDNGAYEVFGQEQEVTYNQPITYATLTNNVIWFKAESWFANEARTEVAPTLMPNQNITVYGAIVFDIGSGDVNGNGEVNVDDITLYRQWIVGGYEMTVVAAGQEYATASAEDFDASKKYYLARVADINLDSSKDIRDVSITRMSIVGGYTWDNENAYNVSGNEIIRNVQATTISEIVEAVNAGKKVTVANDITANSAALNINYNGNISINLNGHKITVESFNVASNGVNKTVSVVNGVIVTTQGITIACPKGNVVLQNLTGYVNDSEVNLQAASSSLHIKENVAFYKNQYDENEPEVAEIPAVVKIADKTHIVVEPQATLIVEKLVVEQNAEISITVNSAETAIIAVEGTVEVENNVAETKVYAEDNALLALVKAAKEGGEFTLEQDYEISEPVIVEGDLVLNLNGHKIYNTEDIWDNSKAAWSLISVRGGNLTINGNGELLAKANDCYALDVCNNGALTVNGGTYTGNISAIYAYEGFVTVNGGEFAIIQKMASGDANRFMLNCLDANYNNGTSNFTVNGGTFNGFNPENNASEGANTNYVTAKHYVEENNGVYTVKEYGKIANEEELLSAVENGGKYQLVADFTVDQTVEITKDFTLEGNNHTITFVGGNAANKIYYSFYVIESNNNPTVANFSNLAIESTGYQVAFMTNLDYANSGANLNNVDITCDGACVYANGFGVVNANNCEFNRNGEYTTGKDAVYYSALVVGYAGTINATDCTVNSDRNGVATFPSGGFITLNNTNVTANGNGYAIWARNEDYNVSKYEAYCKDSVITINSGNIVGEFKITDKYTTGSNNYHEPRIVVNGGTYNVDPTAYLAEGYYAVEENSVYTVGEYGKISTIEELDAATEVGGFWQLVADLDYSTTYTERNARDYDREHTIDLGNMTLDLNGHTISTINATVVFGGNGATIKNGTFDLVKKNTDGSFKEGSYALIIDNKNLSYGANGTVTVENVTCIGGVNVCSATVTLNNVNAQTTPTKFYAVWAEQNANVTINSGNYVDEYTGNSGIFATGKNEEGGATITVNGGTFTANNKLVSSCEANSIQIKGGTFTKDPTAYVAAGYTVTANDNQTYTVK